MTKQFVALSDDKSRMRLLKAWLTDHKLTCSEAVVLLELMFGVGDIAVQAMALMQPNLTDPDQIAAVVLPAFKFEDERSDVKTALGL